MDAKREKYKDKIKKVFGKEVSDKIGTFKEAPGGGKPLAKGEKAPSKDWVAQNRKMQPRDNEGKFTYNAVNLKPLKYGPSRGETTPPIIKGTEFEKAFVKKDTVIITDENRQKIVFDGDFDTFVELFKEFHKNGGFAFKAEAKKGRMSNQEKTAREEVKNTGKAKVINKEKINKRFKKKEEKPDVKKEQPAPEQKAPEQPTQQTSNLKQTAENNKELINQMVEFGVSPAEASKIVSSGKITSVEQFKQIMGL